MPHVRPCDPRAIGWLSRAVIEKPRQEHLGGKALIPTRKAVWLDSSKTRSHAALKHRSSVSSCRVCPMTFTHTMSEMSSRYASRRLAQNRKERLWLFGRAPPEKRPHEEGE